MSYTKQLRKSLGLSTTSVAETIGCSRPTIDRNEAFEKSMTIKYLENLSKTYHVTPETILKGILGVEHASESALFFNILLSGSKRRMGSITIEKEFADEWIAKNSNLEQLGFLHYDLDTDEISIAHLFDIVEFLDNNHVIENGSNE